MHQRADARAHPRDPRRGAEARAECGSDKERSRERVDPLLGAARRLVAGRGRARPKVRVMPPLRQRRPAIIEDAGFLGRPFVGLPAAHVGFGILLEQEVEHGAIHLVLTSHLTE